MYDKEIAETYKEHMIFFVLKSLGIMLVTLGILLALPLLVGKESTGTEYTTYTQEITEINLEENTLLVGNGDELKMSDNQIKNLTVKDIITYDKAEGNMRAQKVSVVGSTNPN